MKKKAWPFKKLFHPSDRTLRAVITALTFLFLSGVVYIPVRNSFGHIRESVVVKTFIEDGSGVAAEEDSALKSALEYNKKVAELHSRETFFYRGASAEDDAYRSLLAGPGGTLCVLEIPVIDVCLPVGHGTSDEILETMAGHVCGTSLPVGGPSANAVIAAHSGSTSARLFTDLDDLSVGDEIYVHVLTKVLTYRILSEHDISVVLPYDGRKEHALSPLYDVSYFQVVPGEDILTLYTCTPIGINSHRLIITAHRVFEESSPAEVTHELRPAERKFRGAFFGAALSLLPIIGSMVMFRKLKSRPQDPAHKEGA